MKILLSTLILITLRFPGCHTALPAFKLQAYQKDLFIRLRFAPKNKRLTIPI